MLGARVAAAADASASASGPWAIGGSKWGKHIRSAERMPRMPAAARWPSRDGQTAAMSSKRPAEKKVTGLTPPAFVAVSR